MIRISGSHALSAVESLRKHRLKQTKSKSSSIRALEPRRATLISLSSPEPPHRIIDTQVLALFFPAPNSFTGTSNALLFFLHSIHSAFSCVGEDVVELHVHGSPVVVRGVLQVCYFLLFSPI